MDFISTAIFLTLFVFLFLIFLITFIRFIIVCIKYIAKYNNNKGKTTQKNTKIIATYCFINLSSELNSNFSKTEEKRFRILGKLIDNYKKRKLENSVIIFNYEKKDEQINIDDSNSSIVKESSIPSTHVEES